MNPEATMAAILGSLGLKLKRHWETHCPRMVAELKANGTLDERLAETELAMLNQEATLIQQGLAPDQAREMTREIGFLPEEDDADAPTADSTTASPTTTPSATSRTAGRLPITSPRSAS